MLTYEPPEIKNSEKKSGKIEVKSANKKHKVVYDNQKRPKYFRSRMNLYKKSQSEKIPQIRLEKIQFNKGILSISAKNFKLNKKPGIGKVMVRIRILDVNAVALFDRKKIVDTFEKKLDLNIRLPLLRKGYYSIVVEVKDLHTSKNDLAFEEIKI